MLRLARTRVVSGLLLSHAVCVLGCPQLLDDRFDRLRGPDAGDAAAGSAGAGGGPGPPGPPGPPRPPRPPGPGGAGGSGGTGGSGGAGGSTGGTGGGGGTGGSDACWTFALTTKDPDDTSNCVGVDGWNDITVDTTTSSSVNLTYQDGRACFDGTIAATGWGAVYNFAFAGGGIPSDGDVWNATNVGVTGFELTTTGASLPPSFGLVFSVNNGAGFRDYCHGIGTGVVSVPFSDAVREDCANTPDTGNLSDLTQLEFLRLSFPITGSSYPVDFCLQLRAL